MPPPMVGGLARCAAARPKADRWSSHGRNAYDGDGILRAQRICVGRAGPDARDLRLQVGKARDFEGGVTSSCAPGSPRSTAISSERAWLCGARPLAAGARRRLRRGDVGARTVRARAGPHPLSRRRHLDGGRRRRAPLRGARDQRGLRAGRSDAAAAAARERRRDLLRRRAAPHRSTRAPRLRRSRGT